MRLKLLLIVLLLALTPLLLGSQFRKESNSRTPRDKYSFNCEELGGSDKVARSELTEDKPLVLFVWAPDCPACLRHMPYAAAMYSKLDLDAVNFISLAMSDSEREVREVVEDKGLEFPVLVSGTGSVGEGFDYDGWPTTYVFKLGGKLQGLIESSGSAYSEDVADAVTAALKD